MAGLMYETYVLSALQIGLSAIQADPTLLVDILDALSLDELSIAQTYFSNPDTVINIAPGFPMEVTKMPFIGVTVATEDPLSNQTPISYEFATKDNGDETWTLVTGIRYRGTIKATIYTPNADLIIWLSAVCWWALMKNIDLFVSTSGPSMNNVVIGTGDYEPSPQWLPLFVFARGVWVTGEYSKTVSTVVSRAIPGTITFTVGGELNEFSV